jgi:drug/metabolite transporter (DMT)-like permease
MIVAAAIGWSTSGAFVKNMELSGLAIAAYRSLAAGVVLFLFAWLAGTRRTFRPAMIGMVICFTAMSLLFITSMTLTTAANTILLQYTAPVWMTLASVVVLKEPVERRSVAAVLGSLIGIAVLLAGQGDADAGHRWGIVFGLASGVAFAGVAVFLRALRDHDSLWLAVVNHLSAGVLLTAALLVQYVASEEKSRPRIAPTGREVAVLAVFGSGQMALPYVLFGRGLQGVSPQEAGVLSLLEPLLNPLWTYLAAGEKPAPATLIGGAILIAALFLRYWPSRGGAARRMGGRPTSHQPLR